MNADARRNDNSHARTEAAAPLHARLDLGLFPRRRVSLILQGEAAECGLACLAMIAGHHGQRVSLPELRRRFAVSLKGTTLAALMDIAQALGLTSRPLRVELDALRQVRTPAVLHWDLAHYVVLVKAGPRTVHVIDPAIGHRMLAWAEVSRHFTGVVLEVAPAVGFQRRRAAERVRLSDLWSGASGFAGSFGQLIVLSLVLQAAALLGPIVNQFVIDDAITRGDLDLLAVLVMGAGLLLILQMGTGLLRLLVNQHVATLLSLQLRGNLLMHLLWLPVSYFEKRRLGDILSRFGSLAPVQALFTGGLVTVVLDGLMAVLTLTVMLLYSPLLTAVVLGALALVILVQVASFAWLRSMTDSQIQLAAQEQTLFLETIRGARAFKLFGREIDRHAIWQAANVEAVNAGLRLSRAGLIGGQLRTFLQGGEMLLVLYLGARLVIDGQMTLGMLLAFQSYRGQFATAAANLVGQAFAFKMLDVHLARLADVVHHPLEPGVQDPDVPDRRLEGRLELRRVAYRYAAHEPWVVRDVDLTIAPGSFVAFVGPSGGGKSTLLKILAGLYPPEEGEVLIDGVPLAALGLRTFRSRIGVVMQDDQLFSGTVADNIAFFDPDPDQVRIERAATMAQVHDEILRMPMGYLTLVGDLGSTLSGGQRQRVLLARALYREPTVLFLDEGTANLDPESERRVMNVLRDLPMTRVVVAHRPVALEGVERVFVVNAGRVLERKPS